MSGNHTGVWAAVRIDAEGKPIGVLGPCFDSRSQGIVWVSRRGLASAECRVVPYLVEPQALTADDVEPRNRPRGEGTQGEPS